MSFPALFLKRREDRRLRAGHPWVYSNEVDVQRSPLAAFEPGQQAEVRASDGHFLGMAYVNPRTLISARVYSRRADEPLDRALLARRVARALALRERLFESPQYRLVHGEGDGLPGLVVDRYGDLLVAQLGTAGMDRLRAEFTITRWTGVEGLFPAGGSRFRRHGWCAVRGGIAVCIQRRRRAPCW